MLSKVAAEHRSRMRTQAGLTCPRPPPTAIGNAYAVLSNPEKRQQYDQYGDQPAAFSAPEHSSRSRPAHYRTFHRDFEADISPEELFNIFFGGRFPTGGEGATLFQ